MGSHDTHYLKRNSQRFRRHLIAGPGVWLRLRHQSKSIKPLGKALHKIPAKQL